MSASRVTEEGKEETMHVARPSDDDTAQHALDSRDTAMRATLSDEAPLSRVRRV